MRDIFCGLGDITASPEEIFQCECSAVMIECDMVHAPPLHDTTQQPKQEVSPTSSPDARY
jgi:hypothetical protein